MLELGHCNGKSLIAGITYGNFHFKGPPQHFHGYKINSGIPGDGVYVEWSATETSVKITTDRLGMLPYFIYHKNNQLIVTHDIHEIFKHARDCEFPFDYSSLAVQLRLGHFLADDTAFLDIKRLPPNSILEFSKEGLKVTFREEPEIPLRDISLEDAIKLYGEQFDQLIEKFFTRNPQPVIVPASGGRDSRHILLALNKLEIQPELCITQRHLPPTSDDDHIYATELCRLLGHEHKILPKTKHITLHEMQKNTLLNYETESHGWIMPTIECLAKHQKKFILDGLGGDRLSESKVSAQVYELYSNKYFRELAEVMVGNGNYVGSFLAAEFRTLLNRESAIDAIQTELEKYQNHSNPVIEFFLRNRTRRCIAPSCWNLFGKNNYVITPFISGKMYNLLISFPLEIHQSRKLHTLTISDRYPKYANLPYAKSEVVNIPTWLEHIQNFIRGLFLIKSNRKSAHLFNNWLVLSRLLSATRSKADLAKFLNYQNRYILLQQTLFFKKINKRKGSKN